MLALFSLSATGCKIGKDKQWIGGLCANDCVNIPYCFYSCFTDSCSCLSFRGYHALTENDFHISATEICQNSQGTGQNGYVTVKVSIENGSNSTYVFGEYIYHLAFKINVYDDGALVGSAIVVRTEEEIENLTQETYTDTYPRNITNRVYTEYFNVAIEEYMLGNYTCSIEWIEGVVS